MDVDASERASASMLALAILLGSMLLLSLIGAVGATLVAGAELQQAADVAARAVEEGGDAARVHAAELARANGARRVEFDEAGTELRITVSAPAPRVLGVPVGAELESTATALRAAGGDAGPNPPGEYAGQLVLVDGIRLCPRVASAWRSLDAAAARDGVSLVPSSGFRSYAEQAVLFAQLGPGIAAPPGVSRHHDATEVDVNVGPAGSPIHRWLQAHAPGHGFIQRYSWEPWHWGFVAGC